MYKKNRVVHKKMSMCHHLSNFTQQIRVAILASVDMLFHVIFIQRTCCPTSFLYNGCVVTVIFCTKVSFPEVCGVLPHEQVQADL